MHWWDCHWRWHLHRRDMHRRLDHWWLHHWGVVSYSRVLLFQRKRLVKSHGRHWHRSWGLGGILVLRYRLFDLHQLLEHNLKLALGLIDQHGVGWNFVGLGSEEGLDLLQSIQRPLRNWVVLKCRVIEQLLQWGEKISDPLVLGRVLHFWLVIVD